MEKIRKICHFYLIMSALEVCAHQDMDRLMAPPMLNSVNDVGIWVMWYEMPFSNKMRDNPSPAGGPPAVTGMLFVWAWGCRRTPANLAMSKECQWVRKLLLKYGVVITSKALHCGHEIAINLLEDFSSTERFVSHETQERSCERKEQNTKVIV